MAVRVAIVDDDASVCKALARLLSASSFEVSTFDSGRELLKSLKVGRPDCLVVDLHMPELTGFDLQRHLNRAGIQIPTVLMSANQHLTQAAAELGVADWLPKPFSCLALLDLVQALLGSR
jgi:FixJ family two-component response regulator